MVRLCRNGKGFVMKIKDIVDEDFQDYQKPSMMIATCNCDWKCLNELNLDVSICQNSAISKQPNIDVPVEVIFDRYINNPITHSVVFAGLEPILQFKEILVVIDYFRSHQCDDDIIIYTGYYPYEIQNQIQQLKQYQNIIVKFGRYKPNSKPVYDEVLGITLVSDNQYAIKIS